MKKHLFGLMLLALGMAACTNDADNGKVNVDDNKGKNDAVEVTQLVKLNVDGNRLTRADLGEEETTAVAGAWIEGPSHLNTVEGGSQTLTHVYSATGIAVNGTTVYISWHSNRAQDLDEDSEEHNHGTNVGEDGSEPSLNNADDWGGMVDVLDFSNGVEGAALTYSYWQPEHKYNHVYFADGNLYLASTSWFVGAALHRVPVNGTELSTTAAQRFNLTGNSANCVVKVDGELVTVSGRTVGGVNWFNELEIDEAFDPEDKDAKNVYNLTEACVNAETADFGGKHIWVDNGTVYVLRNPAAPVVEVYTKAGAGDSFTLAEGVKLTPIDGKNVLTGDADYFYVCCGQYGLHVYDKASHEEVATSHKNTADNANATLSQKFYAANGCDVDEKYVYVANGGGLVVFEKNFDEAALNINGGLKVVKYLQLTNDVLGEEVDETKVLESSNFVKLVTVGDKRYAFVAYGMYGLRIYDLAELYPAEE